MSVGYSSVQWNEHKKLYDRVLAAGLLLAIGAFVGVSLWLHPNVTAETLILRATAVAAFLLLNVILAIGPLARLDRRFLPLLYNRRHLGVTMFLLAFVHGGLALVQFHALGNTNPFTSLLGAYREDYALWRQGALNLEHLPFEAFGLLALGILFLMAATSHDFWLRNLGPSAWKLLHLAVLVAYALLVLHVAFGAMQSERSLVYPVLLGSGAALVLGLHLLAARRERRQDRLRRELAAEGFVRVAACSEVVEGRGKVVQAGGKRLALYRHQDKLFAVSNVCRHQGGPLGEGRVIDGCITCPWHGWQYRPDDGMSPPPFTEVVPTCALRLVDDEVFVKPEALPLATRSEGVPAPLAPPAGADDFYVGYLPVPAGLARFVRAVALALLVGAPAIAALVAWRQQSFDSGVFEFGVVRPFEGVLYERPLPHLRLGGAKGWSSLLLAGAGKFGPPPEIHGHHGERMVAEGSLVYRRGLTMLELNRPESLRFLGPAGEAGQRPPIASLGEAELVGELVDTKCFLGVMRPGAGKVHRACAVRCLAGGVPPGLLVRDDARGGTVFLLTGVGDAPLDFDVQWAGRTLRARGELQLLDEVPVLRVAELTLLP